MSGFNMPPGCSPSDIPGNRPLDVAIEQLTDDLYALVVRHAKLGLDERDVHEAVTLFWPDVLKDAGR